MIHSLLFFGIDPSVRFTISLCLLLSLMTFYKMLVRKFQPLQCLYRNMRNILGMLIRPYLSYLQIKLLVRNFQPLQCLYRNMHNILGMINQAIPPFISANQIEVILAYLRTKYFINVKPYMLLTSFSRGLSDL